MGQTTANISIYIPAAGETNYDASFAAGMINIDQHDHSGGPNKGVPITGSGLANFSVTYEKLNANVVDPTTGIGVKGAPFQNQLQLLGIVKNLYQLSLVPTTGFVAMDGANVAGRTFQNTSSIGWTNPSGLNNPSADVLQVNVNQGGTGVNTLVPYAPLLGGTTATDPIQQPAIGNAGEVLTSQGPGMPSVFTPLGSLSGAIQYASITLTAAQVRTLNGTPVAFIAAPGAGKVLVPIVGYGLLTSSGAAFTGGFPASAISIAYNSTNSAMQFSSNAFVSVTSDVYSWATQNTLATVGGIAKASVQNQPLNLVNFGLDYTGGGTSTITIVVGYITLTI